MLPITPFLPEITLTLAQNRNLVLQAEPGAGKSTALPLSLLEAPWLQGKKIVMLEPRRIAAKTIAHYLAQQLGEPIGQRVGYQVKNERQLSTHTCLEIVTEGILCRRIQSDPELKDVGLIILDEFHERSIHSDLALMLAHDVQQSLRDDLKILIMSATIDVKAIAAYLDNAPIIHCPGRGYPVQVEYLPGYDYPDPHQLSSMVITALKTALSKGLTGDILVFLPGQTLIKRCITEASNTFQSQANLIFLPLYGGLSIAQQAQALRPDSGGKQRVVFSTNIAETSLTIEGVCCVIDSGLEKVSIYDPASTLSRLETVYISQASAEQRKGRAGRLQAGYCLRLWSEARQQSLRAYQGEEILTADLTTMLLDLLAWGLTDIEQIHWLTAPAIAHVESSKQLLIDLGLLNPTNTNSLGKLTALGSQAAQLALHPRLAAMLLSADNTMTKNMACECAALLSEQDIFSNYTGVDIVDRLLALQEYKQHRKTARDSWPIKPALIEQVLNTAQSLKRSLNLATDIQPFTLTDLQSHLGKLLLRVYPDRLAKQRAVNTGRYQLANGKGAQLYPQDPLFGSEWLIVNECTIQKQDGQILSATAISLNEVEDYMKHRLTERIDYRLDEKKQVIVGRKETRYGALILNSQPVADIPEDAFKDCLSDLIRTSGLSMLNWTDECEHWLSRATWLGTVMNNFPTINEQQLIDSHEEWLLPYLPDIRNLPALKKLDIQPFIKTCLSWEHQQQLDRDAPAFYMTPGKKHIRISYDPHQGPTVSVRLQEMFGELDSPLIGANQVPLRFELLSPALRPLQTTSDLKHFWNNSYHDIAKEMRGRYPRHRWPENPLLEKPGHSLKKTRS